jgi:hypothetical protein
MANGEREGTNVSIPELNGFLGIWTDIDDEFIPTFRTWHSQEHMPLRIETPGWYVGHRYAGVAGAPGFLIAYETSGVADLAGNAYHQSMNEPDPRTREALRHYRNAVRTIYGLRHHAGAAHPTDAPYYLTVRSPGGSGNERLLQWFATEHLPMVCSIPGVLRARLYEIDEATSQIMTEERKLYGAGPGNERFLATYELTSADIPKLPAWRDAFGWNDVEDRALREIRAGRQDLFALEFTIYPSHVRQRG